MLRSLGVDTFLPQEEAGNASGLIAAGEDMSTVIRRLFDIDWNGVQRSDFMVAILNGRVPDEGTCVELGMAYALGKPAIGFQSDSRRFAESRNNVMIDGALRIIAHEWDELKDAVVVLMREIHATASQL